MPRTGDYYVLGIRVDFINEPPVSGGRSLFRVADETVLVGFPRLIVAVRKFCRVHAVRVIGLLPPEATAESLQHDSQALKTFEDTKNVSAPQLLMPC